MEDREKNIRAQRKEWRPFIASWEDQDYLLSIIDSLRALTGKGEEE